MPPVPSRVRSTRSIPRRAMQALLLALAMLVPTLTTAIIGATAAGPPTLATDKLDYAPGETVHISGSGYDPGVTYAVPVRRPDTSIVKGDGSFAPGWDTVTADGAGNISYDYQLDGIAGLYEARTYPNPWSGNWTQVPLASVNFTDALNVNLDQCANLTTPCTWQNGNLNQNNSAYAEGEVVPFRLAIEDLGPGMHTIHINYDFTSGGHEAYDFLATYNATETVNLCAPGGGGLSSLCPVLPAPQVIPFESDPFAVPDANNLTVAGAQAAAGLPRQLTAYGATVQDVTVPVHSGPTDGNSTADIVVSFTTTGASSAVLLAWGGHLAASSYWIEGTAPDGAGQISGAPWHMRTQELDGSGNRNQDRSIQPSAIIPPPAMGRITVVKDTEPDGPSVFTFAPAEAAINGGNNFLLDDDGTDTPNPASMTFTVVPGTYHVAELLPNPGFTLASIVCTDANSTGDTVSGIATFMVEADEAVVCTFRNEAVAPPTGRLVIQKDTIPDGDTPFTFTPTGFNSNATFILDDDGDTPLPNTAIPNFMGFPVPAGVPLTVTETTVTGFVLAGIVCTTENNGTPAGPVMVNNPSVTITVAPNEVVTCVFTNRQQGRIIIHKNTVPNDPQIFNYITAGGLSPTFLLQDDGNELVGPFNTQVFTVPPGEYRVQEVLPVPGFMLTSLTCTDPTQNTTTTLVTGLAAINLAAGETVECTFVNVRPGDGGDDYGTDPRALPTERPYEPAPGSQPAGDTGQSGGVQEQPATEPPTSPDPVAEVAGDTEVVIPVAAPADEPANVVDTVVEAVQSQIDLPRTGAELIQQLIAGLILTGGGLVLLALRRRRSPSASA